ncbi:MAG: glutamate-cysteine ligase family protein [Archaeoglobaceae archaeon]|nr:glutamate-cysteine ligase family protein [Archaeoglobaceae archaeon]MCX8151479.1 glutamate-cysteine ligase family protein [Archaeoglobaceae archaeon]MDW8014241.1 glutamate-cysteine ligase family protein [Archaeoglobaceae archaeon]
MIGPEHEFMIVDDELKPMPIADLLIKKIRGRFANEAKLSKVCVGKELQKHVIELKPTEPFQSLSEFEDTMFEGLQELMCYLDSRLIGTGMHPFLKPEDAKVWDHRDRILYETYDRLFNIKQHGWVNIQSFQLNLRYKNEKEAIELHNKLTVLLPYIAALASSSPICEGKRFFASSRLYFYRINQKEIPIICNDIVPERISSIGEYKVILERIYEELRKRGAEVLCGEWVNSRGVIFRFTRKCLEIKVMDEQECIKSDVAVAAFIRSLIRADIKEMNRDEILKRIDLAIKHGTLALRDELKELYKVAIKNADCEERRYLRIVKEKIKNGAVSERIVEKIKNFDRDEILRIYLKLSKCLEKNKVFL